MTLSIISWITLVAGIALAIAAVLVVVPKRSRTAKHPAPVKPAPVVSRALPRSYPGVAIRPHPNACAAAWDQKGKRYLTSDVPVLPLEGCDRTSCQCQYVEYSDRRGAKARRASYVTATGLDTDATDDQRQTGFERRLH